MNAVQARRDKSGRFLKGIIPHNKGVFKLPVDRETLYDLYWNKGFTTSQIAQFFRQNGKEISRTSIERYLKIFDIQCRRKGSFKTCHLDFTQIPKETIGYLAGFLDGEGTIYFSNINGFHFPSVTLANTNEEVMRYIASILKTNVVFADGIFKTYLTGIKNIEYLLKYLYPLLIVKKRKAELVLKFCEIKIKNHKDPLLTEIVEKFKELD